MLLNDRLISIRHSVSWKQNEQVIGYYTRRAECFKLLRCTTMDPRIYSHIGTLIGMAANIHLFFCTNYCLFQVSFFLGVGAGFFRKE